MDELQTPPKPLSPTPGMDVTPPRSITVTDASEPTAPVLAQPEVSQAAEPVVASDPISPQPENNEPLPANSPLDTPSVEPITEGTASNVEPAPLPEVPVEAVPTTEGTISSEEDSIEPPPSEQPIVANNLEVAEPPDEHPITPNPLAIDTLAQSAPHHTPITPIVVAIIVCLTLIGIIAFAYVKTRDTASNKPNVNTSQPTVPAKPQASTNDIDQTNQAIDLELQKTDDNTEFSTNDLANTTLGL